MKLLQKIRNIYQVWIPSIIFNFHYLPFKQAVKLPILLKKPEFRAMEGRVSIQSDKIYRGMIQLGFCRSKVFPDNGICWYNKGEIIFKGYAHIGSNSYIVVQPTGRLEFGDDFRCSTSIKIISCVGITFGKGERIGWENIFIDSNFHPLYDIETQTFKKAYGKIEIGDYNWFSTQCFVMHSVKTPERCIFGARSTVVKSSKPESYCVHVGSPLRIVSRNVMRVYGQDYLTEYQADE